MSVQRVRPAVVAWALAALALALQACSYALAGVEPGDALFIPAIAVAFSAVGALVASRHPRNAMGWNFAGVAVATGVGALAGAYADRWAAGRGGSQALGELAAVYGSLSWIPFILVHLHVRPAAG